MTKYKKGYVRQNTNNNNNLYMIGMIGHFNLNIPDLQVPVFQSNSSIIVSKFLRTPDINIKHNVWQNTKNITEDKIQKIKILFLSLCT